MMKQGILQALQKVGKGTAENTESSYDCSIMPYVIPFHPHGKRD